VATGGGPAAAAAAATNGGSCVQSSTNWGTGGAVKAPGRPQQRGRRCRRAAAREPTLPRADTAATGVRASPRTCSGAGSIQTSSPQHPQQPQQPLQSQQQLQQSQQQQQQPQQQPQQLQQLQGPPAPQQQQQQQLEPAQPLVAPAVAAPVADNTSSMARFLTQRRIHASGCPEEDIEAVLDDYADNFLRASHEESQRYIPNAETVSASIQEHDRASILNWLVQTCEIMRFHETVLYTSILTLDRYSALSSSAMPMETIQRVLMAVMCTALKTCAAQDHFCGAMPVRELLGHLFRQQAQLAEIFATERKVLRALDFAVTAPSVLDFLDVLSAPLTAPPMAGGRPMVEAAVYRNLANFLLQLSLFNVTVHYGHAHVILAASAVYVALCTLQASPVAILNVLGDVLVACPDMKDIPDQVASCAFELHGLWVSFAMSHGATPASILRKFAGADACAQHHCRQVRLHKQLVLSPPPIGALPHPGQILTMTQRSV